jgi:hypothetical protein
MMSMMVDYESYRTPEGEAAAERKDVRPRYPERVEVGRPIHRPDR